MQKHRLNNFQQSWLCWGDWYLQRPTESWAFLILFSIRRRRQPWDLPVAGWARLVTAWTEWQHEKASLPYCPAIWRGRAGKQSWGDAPAVTAAIPHCLLTHCGKTEQETQSHIRPHISIVLVMGIYFLPELHHFRMKDSNALIVYHFLGNK